jgi:hypothetical protein
MEHLVRKLCVELAFERQHEVDAGVRAVPAWQRSAQASIDDTSPDRRAC